MANNFRKRDPWAESSSSALAKVLPKKHKTEVKVLPDIMIKESSF